MSNLLAQVAEPQIQLTKHQRYQCDACPSCGKSKTKTAAACIACIRAGKARPHKRRMTRIAVDQPSDSSKRIISLTRGYVTVVDAFNYERLMEFNWYAFFSKPNTQPYAASRCRAKDGKMEIVRMQNFLFDPPAGMIVDHKDGNRLNNCMDNFRLCVRLDNARNVRRTRGVSGYIGVVKTPTGRYVAQISDNGKYVYVGTFDDPKDAAQARDKKAIELHGDFAVLNFPNHSAPPLAPT